MGMSIAAEFWEPADRNAVHLAFLRAEWHKYPDHIRVKYNQLLDSPSLGNVSEDELRYQLLAASRGPLLQRIPRDTEWFRVSHLRRQHLTELLVINHAHWISSTDRNELLKVVERRPEPLNGEPTSWAAPILWGHSKKGRSVYHSGGQPQANRARWVT